jgi:AcrR family transcriptional regulator
MEDIAGRLGMTKGNLYRYCRNKQDLYHNAVSHALLRWQNYVAQAIAGEDDARRQFMVMCARAIEYLSLDSDFRNVLIRDPDIFPLFPAADPFEEINRNSLLMARTVLQNGIKQRSFRDINPDATAEVLFLIYKMMIIRMYIHTDEKTVLETAQQAVDLLANGLFKTKPSGGTQ